MAKPFDPRKMLRQISNALLREFFEQRGELGDVPWNELTETKIEPIFEAWQALPDGKCKEVQVVLHDINELADERGLSVLAEEIGWRSPERMHEFTALEGRADRAMWVYLNAHSAFTEAALFARADALEAGRYWVKRSCLPSQPVTFNDQVRDALQAALSEFYWPTQLRGRHCSVDHYARANGAEYFFAYLDDYPDAHVVFDDSGNVVKRTDRYAFQNVFVFSPADGSLDLFARGGNKVCTALQQAFCRAVLGIDVGPEDPLRPAYQLDHVLDPNCPLPTEPGEQIAEVRITRMRLESRDAPGRYIEVKANPKGPCDDIYQMIQHDLNQHSVAPSRVRVRQAGFRLLFMSESGAKPKTLGFNVSCPNSCGLKSKPDEMRAIGERCLRSWRVTP